MRFRSSITSSIRRRRTAPRRGPGEHRFEGGTNSLHRTAYGFFRDGALTRKITSILRCRINDDVRQFRATVGGPITKDKLFSFAGSADEHDRGKSPSVGRVHHSSMLHCSGAGASSIARRRPGCFRSSPDKPHASTHFILACLAVPWRIAVHRRSLCWDSMRTADRRQITRSQFSRRTELPTTAPGTREPDDQYDVSDDAHRCAGVRQPGKDGSQ